MYTLYLYLDVCFEHKLTFFCSSMFINKNFSFVYLFSCFKMSPNVGNKQIISLPFLVGISFFDFLSYFYVGLYMSVAPNTIWYYVSWIKLEFNNKQVILYPLKKPCIIFLHFYVNLYPSITPNTRLYYVYYGCVSL